VGGEECVIIIKTEVSFFMHVVGHDVVLGQGIIVFNGKKIATTGYKPGRKT
jgi:hypothetical protein